MSAPELAFVIVFVLSMRALLFAVSYKVICEMWIQQKLCERTRIIIGIENLVMPRQLFWTMFVIRLIKPFCSEIALPGGDKHMAPSAFGYRLRDGKLDKEPIPIRVKVLDDYNVSQELRNSVICLKKDGFQILYDEKNQ